MRGGAGWLARDPHRDLARTVHVHDMGHHTAQVTLTLDHAAQARTAAATPAPRDRWGSYRTTFEAEMIRIAVGIWRDEEAGRWDSENAGGGMLTPVMPSRVIGAYLDEHHGEMVTASVIIPVAADADVLATTTCKSPHGTGRPSPASSTRCETSASRYSWTPTWRDEPHSWWV